MNNLSENQEKVLDLTKFIVPDEKGNLYRVKFVEGDERNQYADRIDEWASMQKENRMRRLDSVALMGISLDADAVLAARKVSSNFASINDAQKMTFGYRIPRVPRSICYARPAKPNEWQIANYQDLSTELNPHGTGKAKTINLYRTGVVSDKDDVDFFTSHYYFSNANFQKEESKNALGLQNMDALIEFIEQMPNRQVDKQQADLGVER